MPNNATIGNTALMMPKMQEVVEASVIERRDFDTLPTSPALHLANQAINAFGAGRPIKANRNTKITYNETNADAWSITSKNKSNELTLSIDNINLLKSNNKGLKKCFAFILVKCNEQNYRQQIGFPLQALVDNGMYSTLSNARRGLSDNVKKIMAMTFEGTSKKGSSTLKQETGKMIYHMTIENNYVTLYFSDKINVAFMAQYFTLLPKFAFALTNNAFTLLEYIFYLARQNTRDIKEKGYFNISLRAIRDYLNLPDEADTKKHTQYIRQPIEDAIDAIEEANNNSSFTITPIYNENCKNIREWLDGYIQVGLKDDFASTFIKIAEDTAKKVEQRNKRKEKAQIMAEAKKIENAEKSK